MQPYPPSPGPHLPLTLPLHLAVQTAATPSTAEVLGGTGPSGAVATAKGNFSTPASGNGTGIVTGLLPATNYTVSHSKTTNPCSACCGTARKGAALRVCAAALLWVIWMPLTCVQQSLCSRIIHVWLWAYLWTCLFYLTHCVRI